MWFEESFFYQIFPLGFCGAPNENDGVAVNRIEKVARWIPHMKGLGVDALYLCPVFESDRHGYDTRDYAKIDCRLGSNAQFAQVCGQLHQAGIKVVLDGVFNHVGRGFWAFRDVLEKRWDSPYKDWFHLSFEGDSPYGDGLWYEGWEGHFNLVKLNLGNPQVVDYLLGCVKGWIEEFGIDGLRLDVAYLLPEHFLERLRHFTKAIRPDFFLLGEAIHGDYNRIVNDRMLDSCTNYECFKGIFSSFNDNNLFEIGYSLNRQFGPEYWTLYKGKHLFNFVDNHDVDRIASRLKEPRHLPVALGLLFGMPGIPCLYYGSEWGALGQKTSGDGADDSLRPCFAAPVENELTGYVSALARIRRENPALSYGGYRQLYQTNRQLCFLREWEGKRVMVAVNGEEHPHTAHFGLETGEITELMTGERTAFAGSLELPPYATGFYLCD